MIVIFLCAHNEVYNVKGCLVPFSITSQNINKSKLKVEFNSIKRLLIQLMDIKYRKCRMCLKKLVDSDKSLFDDDGFLLKRFNKCFHPKNVIVQLNYSKISNFKFLGSQFCV